MGRYQHYRCRCCRQRPPANLHWAGSLTISDRVSDGVEEELSRRGHKRDVTASPIASPVMLYIDQASGVFYAAGDPEIQRQAAGLV